MKKLDIGCGAAKKEGFIGVDKIPFSGVDIVHNLDTFPYPFADNEFEEIEMRNVIEHFSDPSKVMEEIHRISSPTQ